MLASAFIRCDWSHQDAALFCEAHALSLACCSYIGPFTKKYRDELVNKHWVPFLETAAGGQRIPMAEKPDPMSMLADEATIAVWSSQGLPDDKVSIENGSIVTSTQRWPLLIDPQLQGIAWVREKEKANGLIIVRLDQKDMLRKLEMVRRSARSLRTSVLCGRSHCAAAAAAGHRARHPRAR